MNTHSENTVLKRLLAGSAMSMVNLGLAIGIGLVLSPYIIHTLGDRLYGMWALVGTLTGFYGMFDMGISGAVSRYITTSFSKGDKDAVNSYASIGYYVFLMVGAVGLLISIGVAFFVRWLYPDMEDLGLMRLVIIILGVNFAIDFPLRVFSGIIGGCLRSDLTATRSIVFRLISAVATFFALYLGGRLIALSLVATTLALINTVVFYIMARHVFPDLRLSPKSAQKEHLKPLFTYSMFTAFTSIMDLLKFRLNNFFVAGFLTLETLTHYTIQTTLTSYGMQLLGTLTGWLTSWFTRLDAMGKHEDIRNHLIFVSKISVYLSNFIIFGLLFWSAPFITRWVGAEYLDIFDTLLLVCFPIILIQWTDLLLNYLYASAKHYYWSVLTVFDSAIYLLVLFFVIRDYGTIGLPMASSVAAVFTRIIALPLITCPLLNIGYFFYWRYLLTAALRSIICLLLPYFVSQYLVVPEYKWLFLNGSICVILYSTSIFFIGFSKEERIKVWNKLKRQS